MRSAREHDGLIRAVLLDFYGTLAEYPATGPAWAQVLEAHGYELDEDARRRFWDDGLDGIEHDEHSQSRDHYVAWQRSRGRNLLTASGVPEPEHERLVDVIQEFMRTRRAVAYDETAAVLATLRARGVRLAICSNWDWDLDRSVEQAGITGAVDVVVSSAWVGARKPHPRIYAHTLEALGVGADECLFVGDTWRCDVEGPRAAGLRTVYVRRPHFGPDRTAPAAAADHADVVHTNALDVLVELIP